MEPGKRLKDIRDALWQAAIESRVPTAEAPIDPYSKNLDELAAGLARIGVISDSEAWVIISFLDRYSPDESRVESEKLRDDVDSQLAAVVAKLRSVRLAGDRDIGGLGPGGGESNVMPEC